MPLYEYKCSHCEAINEIILPVCDMDSKNGYRCRKCNIGLLKRQVSSGTNFKLSDKGKVGWENTGYGENILGNLNKK